MSTEVQKKIALEIAHVLFIDIVGYSKLPTTEQNQTIAKLNELVQNTERFQAAEKADRLLRIPTGDGMALVFYTTPEEPVRCAVAISRALKDFPNLQVRMGVHSGSVSGVVGVDGRANVAGAGINIAQRVMNCGDGGHILLSKHAADDLAEYEHWRPLLHDLGSCEVKHGVRVSVTNLYSDEVGNGQLPSKLEAIKKHRARVRWAEIATTLVALAAIVAAFFFFRHPRATAAIADKSIAVLPFDNLSSDKENAYFTDGVQDEILTHLAKMADLKVISRTSVMQYKSGVARNLREIGQQLGVAHVLEGSVQRANNRVRVNAQLIDARTDKHLWAKTYDRELADVFAIETELAQLIANELQAKLSASEKASVEEKPTHDLTAYDFYVRAAYWIDSAPVSSTPRNDLSTAVDFLNQAIARDPTFVLAYCRLAAAHDAFYFQGVDHTSARLALAQSAIDSAFQLKPDSGEAHLALASHLYYGYFDFDRARAELAIAQRTLPNNPDVFFLSGIIDRRQSRWADAVRNLKRAAELDPRNVFTLSGLGVTYWQLRDYEQVKTTMTRISAVDPNRIDVRLARGSIDVAQRADTRSLDDEIEKILAEDPVQAETDDDFKQSRFYLALVSRNPATLDQALAALPEENSLGDDFVFNRDFWRGLIARMKGDDAVARARFTAARTGQEKKVRARPDSAPYLGGLGLIDAGLGRKEEALTEGRRAVELAPLAKNSIDGAAALTDFAMICAWSGERTLAIEQLEALAKIPAGPSYGDLRLHPLWDPLRGDPRFEKIVASLAPKE